MGDSLHREVYWMLRHTSRNLKNDLRKKIEAHNITWEQFHALYHIENTGIPFKELACELGCNASNMTGIIDRMVENGWVYREHSEKDRRVWLIKLTESGLNLKTTLIPKHRENIKESMNVLSESEIVILKELLTKLVNKENREI